MTRTVLATLGAAAALLLAEACATTRPAGDSAGDRLYRSRCAACHRLYPPQERTREEWSALVARMAPRAHLSDDDRARLLEYLQDHAKDAR